MRLKVFISSTYTDLIPFRETVWKELDNLQIEILGMEKFGARKSAPLSTCLEEVSNSDIFIGIIGFRYGSVDKKTKKSFSQLEYEKAVELDKEILIYLMDDNALVNAKNVDTGINSNRLKKFKKVLKINHTIDSFQDPNELASKIHVRLNALLPKLVGLKDRPKALNCTVTRFTFNQRKWIAFVGYLNDKPYEIFTGVEDDEMFPIPTSIVNGTIIKNINDYGKTRFDFQYKDKYGYRNTLGGLNHVFDKHASKYTSMINKLLQKNIDYHELIDVIDEMDAFENFSSEDWKKGVKKALGIDKL